METAHLQKPASRASWLDPFIILIVTLSGYYLIAPTSLSNTQLIIALTVIVTLVMGGIETWRASKFWSPRIQRSGSDLFRSVWQKTLGIYLNIALTLAAWYLIPEYMRSIYASLFQAMLVVLPLVVIAVPIMIVITEWRLGFAADYAHQCYLLCMRRFSEMDWATFKTGLFGYVGRGFFLPLNFTAAVLDISKVRGKEDMFLTLDWPQMVNFLDNSIFSLLLISIIPGYILTSRLMGISVKAAEGSAFAWFFTLLCYPPINRGTGGGWFHYKVHTATQPWITWFGSDGWLSIAVGSFLIFTFAVHYWGESIFCLRSSHLTNRGIVTNGPFRITKHPVYLIKCISWAVTFLPFLGGNSIRQTASLTLAFLAFCFVYVMRSWVEERLLAKDADYVAYALWMDEHALLRPLGRWIPFFSFRWRLKRWQNNGMA